MTTATPRPASIDLVQAERVRRQMEEAFAPHRCWVTINDAGHIDFEVMTQMGEPVVALASSSLRLVSQPADLAALLAQAKQVGREHGHSFNQD